MKQLFKKTIATLISLTLILSWAAFARDITVNAGSYATASFYRVQGTDRYDTANKIAAQGWDETSTVVLASGMSYPDALAGAPLAYALDAPILLVTGSSVPASVMKQIYDLGASNIYILGGTAAVSSSIEQELRGKNFTVNRIWGQNRYETSVEVAKTLISIAGSSDEAFVVSGENYPDALAVSPVASLKGAPIVYSNKKGTIDSGSAALLRSAGASRAYVIGGTAAIGSDVNGNLGRCGISSITRISGNSRYDTALKVADHFIDVFTAKSIAFATGENYPDALAGGVFAAKKGMPVLLTNSKLNAQDSSSIFLAASAYNDSLSFTENLVAFIEKFQPEEVFVFGGQNAVPNVTIDSYFDGETWDIYGNPNTSTVPEKGVTVSGTVYATYEPVTEDTKEYGPPLSGVSIVVTSQNANDGTGRVSGYTDSHGNFSFPNLTPGTYTVRLVKEGYESNFFSLEIGEGEEIYCELFMYAEKNDTSGTISGYVMLDGKPVSGAWVELYRGSTDPSLMADTYTDYNGYYEFEVNEVRDGKFMLYSSYGRDYESNTCPVTLQNGGTARCNLELHSKGGGLTLLSFNAYHDNEPVSGAKVIISYTSVSGEGRQSIELVTNDRGNCYYWIDDAKECDVYAIYETSSAGYQSAVTTINLNGEETIKLDLILLEIWNSAPRYATVYGYVLRDGKPAPGGSVVTLSYEPYRGPTTIVEYTENDGYYEIHIDTDTTQECTIYASYGNTYESPGKVITVAAGSIIRCNLDLEELAAGADEEETATIYGYVEFEGKPIAGATVTLSDYYTVLGGYRDAMTDSDGYYTFYNVPVGGLYSVVVDHYMDDMEASGVGGVTDFMVSPGGTHRQDIDLMIY